MTNYNDMPDFEINKLVRIALHGEPITDLDKFFFPCPDYCNSWSDMGPIIDREKICLEHHSYTWEASLAGYEQSLRRRFVEPQMNDNPLRAAAIVYLMIKEGE